MALLGAKHSMRAENTKKERDRKKVDLVYAVVLSHCHSFFLTTPYDRGRQDPKRWRHTLRNINASVHVCMSCTNTISGFFLLKTHKHRHVSVIILPEPIHLADLIQFCHE